MNKKDNGIAIVGNGYVGRTTLPTQIHAQGLVGTTEVVVDDLETTLTRTFEIPVVKTIKLSGQEKRRQKRKNNRKK